MKQVKDAGHRIGSFGVGKVPYTCGLGCAFKQAANEFGLWLLFVLEADSPNKPLSKLLVYAFLAF